MGNNVRRITKQKWYEVELEQEVEIKKVMKKEVIGFEYFIDDIKLERILDNGMEYLQYNNKCKFPVKTKGKVKIKKNVKMEVFYDVETGFFFYDEEKKKVKIKEKDLKEQYFIKNFKPKKSKMFDISSKKKIIEENEEKYIKISEKNKGNYDKNIIKKRQDGTYRKLFEGEAEKIGKINEFKENLNELFGFEYEEVDTRKVKYPFNKVEESIINKFKEILLRYKKEDFVDENSKITLKGKLFSSLRNESYSPIIIFISRYYDGEEKLEGFSFENVMFEEMNNAFNGLKGSYLGKYQTMDLDSIQVVIDLYSVKNLIDKIEECEKIDFVKLKEIIKEHYKETFPYDTINKSFEKELNDSQLIILKKIHDYVKGRYRKSRKERLNDEEIKALFKGDFEKKLYLRIRSTALYNNQILNRNKRYLSNDKYNNILSEIIKAEDTYRRKLIPMITEVQYKYFNNITDKEDLIGKGIFPNDKLKDCNLYGSWRLRNHLYHYQVLKNSEDNKYIKEINETESLDYADKIEKIIDENIKGNNIETEDQKKIIKNVLHDYRKDEKNHGFTKFFKISKIKALDGKSLYEKYDYEENKNLYYYHTILYKTLFLKWLSNENVSNIIKDSKYIFKGNNENEYKKYETQPRIYEYINFDNFNISNIRAAVIRSCTDELEKRSKNKKIDIYISVIFNEFLSYNIESLIEEIKPKALLSEDFKNINKSNFANHLYKTYKYVEIKTKNEVYHNTIKYILYLESLKEKYINFEKVWKNVYIKNTGYEISFKDHVDALKSLINVLSIDIDYERINNSFNEPYTVEEKSDIIGLYNIENEEDVKYSYYSENEKKVVSQSLISFEEEKEIINRNVLHEQKYGTLKYIKELHKKYQFDYREAFEIYGIFKSNMCDSNELEKIWNYCKVDEIKLDGSSHKDTVIEVIQKKYEVLYKELKTLEYENKKKDDGEIKNKEFYNSVEFQKLKGLKKVINEYNFLSNMIKLNSIIKIEGIYSKMYGRISDFYRKIEKDLYFLLDNGKDYDSESIFKNDNIKLLSLAKSDLNKRNNITHKNKFQTQKKEDNKIKYSTLLKDVENIKGSMKYSTVSFKALDDIIIELLSNYGVEINLKTKDFKPKKLDVFNGILNQISEREVMYIKHFILSKLDQDSMLK